MKRLLLALTLVLTSVSAKANWTNIELDNNFTGQKKLMATNEWSQIALSCDDVYFIFNKSIGREESHVNIVIEIDNDHAVFLSGTVANFGSIVTMPIYKLEKYHTLEHMKKGKRMIYQALSADREWVEIETDLTGFTKTFNELKCK